MYFGLYFQNIQYAHKFKIYLLVNYISLYEFLKCRIFTALENSISFCITTVWSNISNAIDDNSIDLCCRDNMVKKPSYLGLQNSQHSKLTISFQNVHIKRHKFIGQVLYIIKDYTTGLTVYTNYSTDKIIMVN